MLASARLPLGAPGVYRLPDYVAPRLSPQRMDVCAFVGVAPRGPANAPEVGADYPSGYQMITDASRPWRRSVAVAVTSFDEYRRLYGAFEAPGTLPYAVATFFEQGGERAYIVRIVHVDPLAARLDGMARGAVSGVLAGPIDFIARNRGGWGNALRIAMGFTTSALKFDHAPGDAILVDRRDAAPPGTLLRLTDATGTQRLAWCRGIEEVRDPFRPTSRWRLVLDVALAFPPEAAEIVRAWITVADGGGNTETFNGLALSPDHPRYVASVLCDESRLVWPHPDWASTELRPASTAVELLASTQAPFSGGVDDYGEIDTDDFFDSEWSIAAEAPGSGITALFGIPDVTHLVVPDLYVPAEWAVGEGVPRKPPSGGAAFARCVEAPDLPPAHPASPPDLIKLIRDPRRRSDLLEIAALQANIVGFCEETSDIIALIDVPPGLSQDQAERWRGQFDTSWCAAYHPWLTGTRRAFGSRDGASLPRRIPPSAVAAGIVARKEIQRGIQFGPANEISEEIVDLAEPIPQDRADIFHPQGMNCFVREPDGIYLVSARTLARDPQWRQLSVRRLILMLRRTLLRETQWAVFEPNGAKLWRDLRHAIEHLLRRLFRAGAFAGATEAESFFVRIVNDSVRLDRGELLIEIGVAPVEPIEFILLRLRRDGDGTLTLEK